METSKQGLGDQNGQCRKGHQACRRNSVCASPTGPVQGGTADVTPGVVGAGAPDNRGRCSTWGAGHFSTFDGHTYDFSGTCNYVFAAVCKDAPSTFSVQLRRGPGGNISRIIVELGASVVTMQDEVLTVKDVGVVSLPHTSNGLQITPFGQSVRLLAKQLEMELVVMWGPGAHLMVLVERKYMGKMCGLCGNFDGEKTNELLSEDGQLLEPHKYAALQKLDDPNEICAYEAIPRPRLLQAEHAQTCLQLLTLVAPECTVPQEPFLLSCQADMAACVEPGRRNCSCATLSEFSRQCSMAGQPVSSWRGPGLCSVGQCPANQLYRECGETCVRTCSNPRHGCSSFCTFGCFCPEGMVLDDISKNHSCVPEPQCPCMLSGAVYAPGEVTTAACQTCRCSGGHWECEERPCPRRCALEGGSFVTTFDARPYRFHGTCTYVLVQSPQLPGGGSLMAVFDKSGYSHSETSLVAVIYKSSQDKIMISQDEVVTNHGDTKWLPYKTRNITVFRQTSTHLQMVTTFGLELVIQLWPVFQLYITVGPQFRGQTRGLCGNFNGDTTDDFTTSMGITEGTASLFVDSWRAGNCPAALERETDPCSMSQLNKVCAETHCAVLVQKGTVFESCHATVDPKPFYKRCVYQACNYEETLPHICAALGDYALACASRGVLLQGWRSSVDNCSIPCTGNQTFSYDSQACDHTCLSLTDREAECHPSAVPVDGCNCPEGTYLNHKSECVRKAQCPCLLDSHGFILADQSTMVNGVVCHCVNGRLSCQARPQMLLAACSAPKTFQSCSQSSEDKFGAACAPTCQMLATGTPCVPTKCEPGCVCAKGLYENANGQCVPPEECPCEFAGISYPRGAELHTDCKSCTCSNGTWSCQQSAHCPSTCSLYGEGHVVTFDGQRFVFDGNCEYILVTDGCDASDSQPTFKILTENVVCGKSGATCSRAIKILLGGLSIVLADANYTVSGEDPGVHFRVKDGSLHLLLDVTIGSAYNLTLTWNRHMAVFIKVARASQDPLCGLCGNYNGNMKDDFQTRSKYLASSELEFANSWKESPLCGDTTFALDPCSLNAFRRSWAERKCSVINSQTFAACHGQVYRLPYYEACVQDTCACDTGGDCECLCDAVAAYAKACVDKGVCVDWRSPDFCPVYCDFYNTHTRVGGAFQHTQDANCTWHYQPCLCPARPQSVPDNIEGCYNCSQDEYFDHDKGTCVPCSKPSPLPASPHPSQSSRRAPMAAAYHAGSNRVTSGHPCCHRPGHIRTGPHGHREVHSHGPSRDLGHLAAHGALPQHRHAVHSSGHSAHNSSLARPGNARDRHRAPHNPTTDNHHHRDHHTHNPTTDRDHHTHSHTTDNHHHRDHHTHNPTTDTDYHTHNPTTDRDHHTHSPTTDRDHHTNHHTHSNTTDRDHHTHSPTTDRDYHTHSHTTDHHHRDHHTHSPTTDRDHHTETSTPTVTPLTESTAETTTVPPLTETTTGTTQGESSVGTVTFTAPGSPSPSAILPVATSPALSTISLPSPSRSPGTPMTHTAPAAPTGPHTPFTTHSSATVSVHTTSHTTALPAGTSFQTATTHSTPSHPETLPVHVSTSVTSTSHRVITPTESHATYSTTKPPGTPPPLTHILVTSTAPTSISPLLTTTTGSSTATTLPLTKTTTGTTQAQSSVSTAPAQSSSFPSPSSSPASLSPSRSPLTTSVSVPTLPNYPPSSAVSTPSSLPTASSPPPHGPSNTSPLTSPSPSPSAASTSHSIPSVSSVPHSPPPSAPLTESQTASLPTSPPSPTASTPVRPSLSPASAPTLSPAPTVSTVVPSTPRTTVSSAPSSVPSSQSTTAQATSLTTQTPTHGLLSSTLGVTAVPSSPATNLTTRQPSTTRLQTTVFLASSVTAHGSSFLPTAGSVSTASQSISSLATSLPSSAGTETGRPETPPSTGACSVKESEEEVTYQGCTANITMTRCEGVCASAASFNMDTMQVATTCSCCHPVGSYEVELVLPCTDPAAWGQQLVLTVQVFSSCACRRRRCGD
ncbi:mucin-6 [Oryx dammah]|uniref:mucin-6 n=1 Tax=Oryx dammah TaxID=59534 RepID=UPI001A9BB725|nr:mucin-6 [Oryx dammah]